MPSDNQRSGSRALKIVAIVIAVIVILAVIAEIGLRIYVANEVRTGFEEENPGVNAQEEVDVSYGATPLLFAAVSGKVDEFSLRTPSTLEINGDDVTGAPAADVTLDGVALNDSLTADHATITADIPDDLMLAAVRQQIAENVPPEFSGLAGQLTVTDLTTDPARGVIAVDFAGGAATLDLTPQQQTGRLNFSASGGQILGFSLPTEVTDQITTALQDAIAGQSSGQGLHIDNLELIDGGIKATLSAANIPLRELSQATQPAE